MYQSTCSYESITFVFFVKHEETKLEKETKLEEEMKLAEETKLEEETKPEEVPEVPEAIKENEENENNKMESKKEEKQDNEPTGCGTEGEDEDIVISEDRQETQSEYQTSNVFKGGLGCSTSKVHVIVN